MIDLSPLDRHERVSLSFSGGKDSLAVVYLLRSYLDRITLYHLDTGDLLPEVREIVRYVEAFAPNFVRIQGDVAGWIAQNGLPTDLLPHSAHVVGQSMGEHGAHLVPRYMCCHANLMLPLYERMRDDGNTLVIRGTKAVDMARLPVRSGETEHGIELWLPLQDWSHDDVFAYLRSVGAPISRIYDHVVNSPECARCSAWWGEKRASYLKQYHPEIFEDYAARLRIVWGEIVEPVRSLQREFEGIG